MVGCISFRVGFGVALLAEGVDRNGVSLGFGECALVALLAEGVDRNSAAVNLVPGFTRSPSSRRAWIEIGSLSPISSQN